MYFSFCDVFVGEINGFMIWFVGFFVFVFNMINREEGFFCFYDNGIFNWLFILVVIMLNCEI